MEKQAIIHTENVPIPAPCAITGEDIQVNFCRNLCCPNFSTPPTYQQYDGSWRLTRNYKVRETTDKNDGIVLRLECLLCGGKETIRSNLGIAHLSDKLLRKQFGHKICPNPECGCKDGSRTTKAGLTHSGTPQYKCSLCGKTFSGGGAFRGQKDSKDKKTRFLSLVNRMGVNTFARTFQVGVTSYYSTVNIFSRLVSNWARHFTEQIASGDIDLLQVWSRSKSKQNLDAEDYLLHPHQVTVQTDIVQISLRTLGGKDSREPIDVIVSVMEPSGYVLAATVVFDSDADQQANKKDIQGFLNSLGKPPVCRELLPHAQNYNPGELVHSSDMRGEDTTKTPLLFASGAKVRKSPMLHAHFYYLRQVLCKFPLVVHYFDQEAVIADACLWAFRREILANRCEIFQIKRDYPGQKTPDSVDRASERQILLKDVSARRKAIFDDLARQGLHVDPRKKTSAPLFPNIEGRRQFTHLTDKGVLSDEEIVKLYQFGSILSVDSTIMQIRRRVPGYQRGTRTGHNRGLSFVELFEHPKIAQQLLDIFVFSRNCLKEHFKKSDNIISPILKLGLSKTPLSIDTVMEKKFPQTHGLDIS